MAEEFQIDAEGLALVIGLVEERVRFDIEVTRRALSDEQEKSDTLNTLPRGAFTGLRKHFNNATVSNLSGELKQKELWLSTWRESVIKANPQIKAQRNKTLASLISGYKSDPYKRMKLYLILQEAVLIRPYSAIEGMNFSISEVNENVGADHIAVVCGYPQGAGQKILRETERFIKETGNNRGRLVKYALGGALFTAITVGFASPHIGAAVGGAVLGLHGVAATTAGLALLGGGAVAAHGFGIAGGIAVVVGGGALLGAAGGVGVSKVVQLLESNPEIVAESMAKLVNYTNFLSNSIQRHDERAASVRDRIVSDFLDFKHNFEREVIRGEHRRSPGKELQAVQVIGHAYEKMVQGIRA